MRYISIEAVEPGQYLGKTIFSSNGAVLLAEKVQLTVYMITTLKRIGVTMLYIKDKDTDDVEIQDVVSDETKVAVMHKLTEIYQSINSGKDFFTRNISVNVNTLLDEISRNKDVLVQLTDIRTKDNEQYIHAINVCIMSVLIGINMSLNQLQLKELAVGALLHDIGKLELLTDDESNDVKRHHTWRGFELLKSKREFSLLIAHIAFQHHEHMDGSGMPRQLPAEQIHQYARIVAVANTYDNLLSPLHQSSTMHPYEACEHLMALAGATLDRDIVIHFLRTVSIYPTGISVRLTNHMTGVVVGQHRGLPGRPIIRVIKREDDNELEITEIDLAKQPTVFVEAVLS
ncbi:MAG: metal-dependent phosphohydrolase [Paenibacillus sp. RIFOXYA1_FULL_44_5]|nr:MAG: metal-dependent phosphohydrolase [Paenibacillus sp. RIFOXYA1_FULL_44_5]